MKVSSIIWLTCCQLCATLGVFCTIWLQCWKGKVIQASIDSQWQWFAWNTWFVNCWFVDDVFFFCVSPPPDILARARIWWLCLVAYTRPILMAGSLCPPHRTSVDLHFFLPKMISFTILIVWTNAFFCIASKSFFSWGGGKERKGKPVDQSFITINDTASPIEWTWIVKIMFEDGHLMHTTNC